MAHIGVSNVGGVLGVIGQRLPHDNGCLELEGDDRYGGHRRIIRQLNWQEIVAKREVVTPAKVSATSTIIIPEPVSRPKQVTVRKRRSKLHRHREKPMPVLVAMRG
jgi:hypothetical protein